MDAFDSLLENLLRAHAVPGLSLAIVHGETVEFRSSGRCKAAGEAVDAHTVFQAASLSKPVVAYATLRLVDQGALALDEPLSTHVRNLVPGDPRGDAITVRHVLSHTTGLPNWGGPDRPFRTHFPTGERFSYSGEGFVGLQVALRNLTGEPFERLMERLVLEPLGMGDSSFVWQDRFEDRYAPPHDKSGALIQDDKFHQPNAAYSLYTTAHDYARFLQAVLTGAVLAADTARLWLSPHVPLPADGFESLEPEAPATHPHLAWGLGWGIDSAAATFFQWGQNSGATAFAIGSSRDATTLAMFANGDAGLALVPPLVENVMPGKHACLDWLGLRPSVG